MATPASTSGAAAASSTPSSGAPAPIVPAPDAATMPATDALARVQAFADDAMRTVSDAAHSLADHAGRLADDSQQFVREHPASTLGSAFALCLGLGVLLGLRD